MEELHSISVRSRTKELQQIREWLHGKRRCCLKAWLLVAEVKTVEGCTQNLAFPTFLMQFEYVQAWGSCGRDLNFFSFFLLSLWIEHVNLLQSNDAGSCQGQRLLASMLCSLLSLLPDSLPYSCLGKNSAGVTW